MVYKTSSFNLNYENQYLNIKPKNGWAIHKKNAEILHLKNFGCNSLSFIVTLNLHRNNHFYQC